VARGAPPIYAPFVRRYVLAAWLAVVVPAAVSLPGVAVADFDPSGRGKKPPRKPATPKPATPKPATPKPAESKPGEGRPPAAPAGRGPSEDALIARYTAIVLSQPSAPFPIQRLAQLYRERDGNLAKLVADLEQRAAAGGVDAWPAKVALAGAYRQDGRYDDAIRTYQAAIAERPADPAAILALAELELGRGDKAAARGHYDRALPLLKVPLDVEQTTRALLGLALDLSDFEGAKRYHDALVKTGQGSLLVKGELGRELFARGHHDRAEVELREVVKAAAGDSRALAPALRDLGRVLAKQRKMDEAIATLKRALAVAGGATGLRAEILAILTDAFRADGKLVELLAILEAEGDRDAQRLATMGALYEETGQVDRALAMYRKVLAADARAIDVRVRLVHLLQAAGDLDGAIREYEALVRAAPGNPDFVFELAETQIQRGDRPRALKLLEDLERRAPRDEDVLARVADFYERIDEKDRSLKVMQRLAASSAGDPTYLVDLGDRYFQAGDKKRALETWARIRAAVPSRARAAAALGEVYLDHDMPEEALAAMREAAQAEPANARYTKALAIALERTAPGSNAAAARYREARELWEGLLAAARGDKLLAREARTHLVSLWAITRELPSRVAPLQASFAATPPDLEAGRLLAEVQRKLGRLADAAATLRRVVEVAPGDDEALVALERVLVQSRDLPGAIEALKKLAAVDPKRARELYQRMAQYAAELYRDDEAIEYAARAVELSPEDATGHEKLGDMYRRRQDTARAVAEYRQAIAKNDRLFSVYFDLADLLLSSGQVEEADRLYRRVVRASPDEELVARAARLSMQIGLGSGRLEELERELLPAAVGNPQKTIYRTLLVEVYGAMTFPLVQKARLAGRSKEADDAARAARTELARIGARAVKPLLDALADPKQDQQKVAIEVLAYVQNRSAGPALFNYATGPGDKALRVRAMLACGALADPALLPRFEQVLVPKESEGAMSPNDAVAVAAAWGVARLGDAKAEPLLVRLLGSPSPDVRALGALGLGLHGSTKHAPLLVSLARSPEAGATARAAAILALGELGDAASGAASAVAAAADGRDALLSRAALVTLAKLAQRADAAERAAAAEVLAGAVFAPSDELAETAALAATALATSSYRRAGDPLPVPDGAVSLRDVLAAQRPAGYTPAERARALVALAPALEKAAVAAVATSPVRAAVVAERLLGPDGAFVVAPFAAGDGALDPALAAAVSEAAERIAAAVVPGFVALVRHPSIDVRARAVELLARRTEPEAQAAVADALSDPDEAVVRAALAALGPGGGDEAASGAARVLSTSPSWPLRVRAAEALGRVGRSRAAFDALTRAARGDAYALVREAAMRALALDPDAAREVLEERAARDEEPRVRDAAKALLGGAERPR
jgi:tetratricopeptide (TPR) repeat protein